MGFFDRFKKKKNAEPEYDTADRYQVEHRLLPQWFLGEDGPKIITAVLEQKGEFFTGLYQALHKDEAQYSCPYSPEDFRIQGVRFDEGNQGKLVLHIQMPKPERVPLCSSVFIVHDEHFENRRYITTELSASGGLVICEWSGGSHSFYCNYSKEALQSILTE